MTEVQETILPGVGVRHDFTTAEGRNMGVVVHHDGRREIVMYKADDPDACSSIVSLNATDTQTLGEILGVSVVAEAVSEVRQELAGFSLDWVELGDDSPGVGTTIGDGEYRTRTGASIVAVIRNARPLPSPGPEFTFFPGDIAIIVGSGMYVFHREAKLAKAEES